jgi:hypothetical protein
MNYATPLKAGPLDNSNLHGGLALARVSTLPDSVVARAEQLCGVLDAVERGQQTHATNDIKRNKLMHDLLGTCKRLHAASHSIDSSVVKKILQEMQQKHRINMTELTPAPTPVPRAPTPATPATPATPLDSSSSD